MADLNVFQLTNQELHKADKKVKKTSKVVKESVSKRSRKRKPFNIPANKIKTESLHKFLEDGDEDITVDYTPDDDIVLVVDPEMDEVPDDLEAAEDQAEDLVGDHVCKCSICGANYVTDADITEDFEMEDEQCPVCGETGEQIVVGVITPTEELSDEDQEDVDDSDIEEEEIVDDEDGDFEEEEVEEDEEVEESFSRRRRPSQFRRVESRSRMTKRPAARKPMASKKYVSEDCNFDELTLNRMLTTFAKENYSNVKSVRISKGKICRGKMTLEGVVTTTKGSKRAIKLVSESFKMSDRMSIKFKEYGPFTESVKTDKPAFVIECVVRKNTIIPMALRYSFKAKNAGMKESKATYSVTGRVLSESVKRPTAKRPTARRGRR